MVSSCRARRPGDRRGATVRPTLTVPREIIDAATGEELDVVQDNDPDLPPESDLQEPDRSLDPFPARR